MQKNTVAFIAFLEQDNLGVGYMASLLLGSEIDIKIVDFRAGKETILEQLLQTKPLIAGFSVIFQYHIYDFRDLIVYLRENGVKCHFTAGGHYPSLRYTEFLDTIPEFDSVVLFEGEYTLLELARSIHDGREWKNIEGIAYRENGSVLANPLRPLEENLDLFPPPVRQPLKEYALGKKYATLLAGRGCYYNCTFCSIREFYSKPPGPVKRIRRPEMVVREMELLHQQLDCSIFMFQDDDFPVLGAKGKEWTTTFCDLLVEKGLDKRFMWKINCRPDEVEPELFQLMKDTGLFLVYLGIENGTEAGLKLMDKKITPETNVEAVRTLNKLGIKYDYGFMLFDPESTFATVVENLDFLQEICGDGSSPVTFCKMLPYAETQIETKLKKEGRLKGDLGFSDYDFYEPAMNRFYSFLTHCFQEWIADHAGLLNLARWARYHSAVYKKYYPETAAFRELDQAATELIAQSNTFFVDSTKELVNIFDHGANIDGGQEMLNVIGNDIRESHQQYQREMSAMLINFEELTNLRVVIP